MHIKSRFASYLEIEIAYAECLGSCKFQVCIGHFSPPLIFEDDSINPHHPIIIA